MYKILLKAFFISGDWDAKISRETCSLNDLWVIFFMFLNALFHDVISILVNE